MILWHFFFYHLQVQPRRLQHISCGGSRFCCEICIIAFKLLAAVSVTSDQFSNRGSEASPLHGEALCNEALVAQSWTTSPALHSFHLNFNCNLGVDLTLLDLKQDLAERKSLQYPIPTGT